MLFEQRIEKIEKKYLTEGAECGIIAFVDEQSLSAMEKSPSLVEGARLEIV